MTEQFEFGPQLLGHGWVHLKDTHVMSMGHSWLTRHSGLQFGGLPIKLLWHEHTGLPIFIWQTECGPHGLGLQEDKVSTAKIKIC